MLKKCINTLILARFLASHPGINVHCNAIEGHWNHALREKRLRYGLPAPLFTIDFEDANLSRETFVSFFDSLSPVFNHMVSLGQCNTTILCPAFTSHSELDPASLADSGIAQTNIRIAVGDENPKELIGHFLGASKLVIDPEEAGFSDGFMSLEEIDQLVRDTYMDVHSRYIQTGKPMEAYLV